MTRCKTLAVMPEHTWHVIRYEINQRHHGITFDWSTWPIIPLVLLLTHSGELVAAEAWPPREKINYAEFIDRHVNVDLLPGSIVAYASRLDELGFSDHWVSSHRVTVRPICPGRFAKKPAAFALVYLYELIKKHAAEIHSLETLNERLASWFRIPSRQFLKSRPWRKVRETPVDDAAVRRIAELLADAEFRMTQKE